MSTRRLAWAALAAAGITAGVALARHERRRRDALIASLAGQLADARDENGTLRERVDWYRALTQGDAPPLRLAQAPRPAARRTAR